MPHWHTVSWSPLFLSSHLSQFYASLILLSQSEYIYLYLIFVLWCFETNRQYTLPSISCICETEMYSEDRFLTMYSCIISSSLDQIPVQQGWQRIKIRRTKVCCVVGWLFHSLSVLLKRCLAAEPLFYSLTNTVKEMRSPCTLLMMKLA